MTQPSAEASPQRRRALPISPAPKKHHYVPQFLLRRFLAEGTSHLHVFDKKTSKSFKARVQDIAAENRFFEFTVGDETKSIEQYLAQFESIAALVLARVIETDSLEQVVGVERDIISALVAQLMLRSPHMRAMQRDIVDKMRGAVQAMGTDPDTVSGLRIANDNEEKVSSAHIIKTETLRHAAIVAEKDWILHTVPAECSLYLSDSPVVLNNEIETPGRGNLGLKSIGIEMYLPISASRCLAMRCPTWSEQTEDYLIKYHVRRVMGRPVPPAPPAEMWDSLAHIRNGTLCPLQAENVLRLNSLQVGSSERFLYSQTGDFALAEEMLRTNPELRVGPRMEIAYDRPVRKSF